MPGSVSTGSPPFTAAGHKTGSVRARRTCRIAASLSLARRLPKGLVPDAVHGGARSAKRHPLRARPEGREGLSVRPGDGLAELVEGPRLPERREASSVTP